MMHRTFGGLLAVCLVAGCAGRKPVVSVDNGAGRRLAAADALVRIGCLDCLTDALSEYKALQAFPDMAAAAEVGARHAAGLVALRQAELGMRDDGFWAQASSLPFLDILKALPLQPDEVRGTIDTAADARALETAAAAKDLAKGSASEDEWSAYAWLTLACHRFGAAVEPGPRREALGALADIPLVRVRESVSCGDVQGPALETMLAVEPRYKELHYALGTLAMSYAGRAAGIARAMELDRADAQFRQAYAWRQSWPALTLSMASVALDTEDYARALEFFDKTLTFVPDLAAARLGRVRALTYLERYEDAVAATEPLIRDNQLMAQTWYWRALGESLLARNDEAWEHVERAAKLQGESVHIPKLAGIIAINRRDFDVARRKLEEAQTRQRVWRVQPPDCEIGFYLQSVIAQLRDWTGVLAVAPNVATCLESEAQRLTGEIVEIRASALPQVRKDSQVARREQQVLSGTRRHANIRFNAAVSSFNLSRKEEARSLAQTLVGDEQFGERARQIVAQTQP